MKKLILLVLAVASLPSCAWAQGVRIDPFPASTIAGSPLPGNAYPAMLAIPGALVSVCNYPANGNPCTNFATTYTDGSLATACPNSAQVTLQNSSTCQNAADTAGNFGFWVSAGGNYTYNITLPGSGQTYGPYAFTAATAGCPVTGCTFTGAISSISVNGVLNATLFAGSDLGAQINAALASAACISPSNPRCTIDVPPGSYTWSTTVTIPANFTWPLTLRFERGAIASYTGSGDALFIAQSTAVPKIRLENLQIRGTPAGVSAIHIEGNYGVVIDSPWIDKFANGSDIWLEGAGAEIKTPFLDTAQNCILLTSDVTDARQPNATHLQGGTVGDCTYGWYHPAAAAGLLYVGQSNSIENVNFEGNTNQIFDEANQNINISNNYFEISPNPAISLGSTTQVSNEAHVVNNHISSVSAPESILLNNVNGGFLALNAEWGSSSTLVSQINGTTLITALGGTAFYSTIVGADANSMTLRSGPSGTYSLLVEDPTNSFNALILDASGNETLHGTLAATGVNGALLLQGTTATITGTSLSAACDSGTASVPGAIVGHSVAVGSTTGADVGGAFYLRASVTAADTVTVYVCGTGTPPSLAYNVIVF